MGAEENKPQQPAKQVKLPPQQFQDQCDTGDILYEVPKEEIDNPIYRHIGFIQAYFIGGAFRGTGLLISPNIVLTCAHNVYRRSQISAKVLFYKNPCGALGKSYKIKQIFIHNNYIIQQANLTRNDYCLLLLQEEIEETSFIKLNQNMAKLHSKATIALFGYPSRSYKCNSQGQTVEVFMLGIEKEKACLKADQQRGEIIYSNTSFSGHSGAPVLLVEKDRSVTLVGVHKRGIIFKENGKQIRANRGRLITKELISVFKEQVQKWGAKMFNGELGWLQKFNEIRNSRCSICTFYEVKPEQMNVQPHQSIGIVLATSQQYSNIGFGNGVLISNHIVLTSAHNVYNLKLQTFYNNITFLLGKRKFTSETCYVSDQFKSRSIKEQNYKHDYAFIKLKESVHLPEFLAIKPQANLQRLSKLAIFGYERKIPLGNMTQIGSYGSDCLVPTSSSEIVHALSCRSGFEGTPILEVDEDDKISIVGIQQGKMTSKSQHWEIQSNFGTFITKELMENLKKIPKAIRSDQSKPIEREFYL